MENQHNNPFGQQTVDYKKIFLTEQRNTFFKKASSNASLVVLLNLLIQNVIAFPVTIVIMMLFFVSNISSYNDELSFEVIMSMLSNNSFLLGTGLWITSIISTALAGILICLIVRKKTGIKIKNFFNTKIKMPALTVIALSVIILGINCISSYLSELINILLKAINLNVSSTMSNPDSWGSLIFFTIMCVIIAPIFEEILFRGVILNSLKRYGNFFAVLVSSLLFGLMHLNLYQAPFAFAIGFVLGYATIKTGSIKVAILLHFINNGFSVLQMWFQALNVPYVDIVFAIILTVCAIMTLVLLIVLRKRINFKCSFEEHLPIPIEHKYKKYFSTPLTIVTLVICGIMLITSFTIL